MRAPLRVGRPVDDPAEREADVVADRVLRMPDPAAALLQRCPGGCPGEEDTPRRQPAKDEEEETVLRRPTSRGRARLPAATRRFFEPRLGADLSAVRVHHDPGAARLAAAVSARAFTVDRDVFLGAGQWALGTPAGDHLLAHELAHTLQQDTVLRRSDGEGTPPAPRPSLLPTLEDLRRWQAEREAPVWAWAASNGDALRGGSLAVLTARVRSDLGDAVRDLSDGEIASALRSAAAARGIALPPEEVPTATGGVNLGGAARSLGRVLDPIPTEIGFDQRHGWALLRFGGPTVGLRSGGTSVGARIGWSGDIALDAAVQDFRFRASLSAERWQLGLRYRIGPGMPDLSRLTEVFTEGEAALRRTLEITAGLDDPATAAAAIGEQVGPVRRAITAASQIAGSRPGRVSLDIGAQLTGPGPTAPPGAAPVGFETGARLTIRF